MTIPSGAPSYSNQAPTVSNLTANPIVSLDTGHFSVGSGGGQESAGINSNLLIVGIIAIAGLWVLKGK